MNDKETLEKVNDVLESLPNHLPIDEKVVVLKTAVGLLEAKIASKMSQTLLSAHLGKVHV